jgi:hypothetical protein
MLSGIYGPWVDDPHGPFRVDYMFTILRKATLPEAR